MKEHGFERSSRLRGVTQAEVWTQITSWDGVNHELAPLVKMTHPARFPTVADVPADGRSHFTSWLLLFGVLPFDAHRLSLRELVAPERFDELSSNLLMKRWSHVRTVEPHEDGGIEVRDRCRFEARVPLLGVLLEKIYAAVFTRRHARLRAHFARAKQERR
ncbi:MAG: hypothetical protein QNK05_23000 [Myxococcota bacterium]|nr:hypothetical protein [Myxococcota bacterium]